MSGLSFSPTAESVLLLWIGLWSLAAVVLTVSDKSVLLGRKTVETLKRHCAAWGVPLQTEIYNFSGTDARAFPSQGITAPALPILIPTTGNHTPLETAALQDIEALNTLLFKLCTDETAVASLLDDIASF